MLLWLPFLLLLSVEASDYIMENLFYITEGEMHKVTAEFFYSVDNENFRGPFIWKRNNATHVFKNIPLRLFFEIKQEELVRVLAKLEPFPDNDLPAFLEKHKEKVDLKKLRAQKEERMGTLTSEQISLEDEEMYLRRMSRFSRNPEKLNEDDRLVSEAYQFISATLYSCFILEMFFCGIMLVVAMYIVQAFYRSRHRIIGTREVDVFGPSTKKLFAELRSKKALSPNV